MSTTGTREVLRRRPDVPDEDIDDIIARAAQLHDAERKHDDDHATVEEVEAVARELDIPPEYVDKAIAAIGRERAADVLKRESAARGRTRMAQIAGLALVGIGLLFGGTVGGAAMIGSSRLSTAALQVDQTAAKLDGALDRQAALAPQLVALAGGEAGPVRAASEATKVATAIPDRLEAAATLNQAMAESIGAITASGDADAQQRLLNLQYEVVGTWNRIDTERARYDEAVASWEHTAASMTGKVALTVGAAAQPSSLAASK